MRKGSEIEAGIEGMRKGSENVVGITVDVVCGRGRNWKCCESVSMRSPSIVEAAANDGGMELLEEAFTDDERGCVRIVWSVGDLVVVDERWSADRASGAFYVHLQVG